MNTAKTLTNQTPRKKVAPTSRCAIYARYSPKPEGVGNENTIDSQIHSCKEKHAAECECGTEPALYIDRMASGKTLDREDLDRLRDDMQNKLIGTVYVHCLDRLSRKQVDLYLLLDESKKYGTTFQFVNGSFDDSPEGVMFLGMTALFAEYERLKFAERSRRGRKQIARSGKPRSSPAMGYRYLGKRDGSQGEYELVPSQLPTVRRIFELAHEGKGNTEIARTLNEEGVPTARAGQSVTVDGKKVEYGGLWHRQTVLQILAHTHYYGEIMEFGSPISVPSIMTKAYWRECHVAQGGTVQQRIGRPTVSFLLSGKLWCGCTRRFLAKPGRRGVGRYCCADLHTKSRARVCFQKSISQNAAERIVWEAMWETLTEPALLEATIREYRESLTTMPKAKRDSLATRLEKARKQVTHIDDMLYDAERDKVKTNQKLAEAKKVLQALEAEARVAQVFEMPSRATIAEMSKRFAEVGPKLREFKHRRGVIEQVIQHVQYAGNELSIHCKIPAQASLNCNRAQHRDYSLITEIPFVIQRLVA